MYDNCNCIFANVNVSSLSHHKILSPNGFTFDRLNFFLVWTQRTLWKRRVEAGEGYIHRPERDPNTVSKTASCQCQRQISTAAKTVFQLFYGNPNRVPGLNTRLLTGWMAFLELYIGSKGPKLHLAKTGLQIYWWNYWSEYIYIRIH